MIVVIIVMLNLFLMRTSHRWFIYDTASDLSSLGIIVDDKSVIEVLDTDYDQKEQRLTVTLRGLRMGSSGVSVYEVHGGRSKLIDRMTFDVGMMDIIVPEGNAGLIDVHVLKAEIILLYILMAYKVWLAMKKAAEQTMYSYTLVTYVGTLLLLSVNILGWIADIFVSGAENVHLYLVMYDTIDIFMHFSTLISPLVFLLALFLIIDNIVLIKKEGRSLTNVLGIALGVFLVGMTFLGLSIYGILDRIGNVHSVSGHYVSLFVESTVYTILAYVECMMLGTVVCAKHAERFVPSFDRDFVIILGCSIRKDGTPTPLLRGRIDRALWFADRQLNETGKKLMFVASGGQGSDEVISEAASVKNYLLEKGVPGEDIIVEDRSTTTRENMLFSNELISRIREKAKIAFSTTGYHVFRSGIIAHSLGIEAVGMGSRTKWYFYTNALIREFIANINIERKKHAANVISIIAIIAVLLQISFVFDLI